MKYTLFGDCFVLACSLMLSLTAADNLDYSYDDPKQWPSQFAQCSGYQQSPIDLSYFNSFRAKLPPLHFHLYDIELSKKLTLRNNGHTIEFSIPKTIIGPRPAISGCLFDNFYEGHSVHFHWGSTRLKGSEHYINGRNYDMEMHILHKNVKYKNINEASKYSDGIAALAVLFEIVQSPYVYYPGLNLIYNQIDRVLEYNSTSTMNRFINLGSLLGDLNTLEFFTYKGSLTTPPCTEVVAWHVFTDILPIYHEDMAKFWNVFDTSGYKLVNNFRPLQSVNSRLIYFNDEF